jgi:anti-sigma-K factor RskA
MTTTRDLIEEVVSVSGDAVALVETAERIAARFHSAYEDLAPRFGYETRTESRVPWEQVPANNRALMTASVLHLLNEGVIRAT